jgi:hypothetical protein
MKLPAATEIPAKKRCTKPQTTGYNLFCSDMLSSGEDIDISALLYHSLIDSSVGTAKGECPALQGP